MSGGRKERKRQRQEDEMLAFPMHPLPFIQPWSTYHSCAAFFPPPTSSMVTGCPVRLFSGDRGAGSARGSSPQPASSLLPLAAPS